VIIIRIAYPWCLNTEIDAHCEVGWRHLIEDMVVGFDDLLWDQPAMAVDFLWIGEERGILKMSTLFINLSKKTCEVCGAPSRRRKHATRCKEHR